MDIEKIEESPKKHWYSFNSGILRYSGGGSYEVDTQKVQSKLKYKYFLIFFLVLSIILSSVSISGCSDSSNSSVNNYLLQVRYAPYELDRPSGSGIVNTDAYTTLNSNVQNKSDLAIRIGYFGTCTKSSIQTNTTNHKEWYCSRNVTHLVDVLTVPTQDPFNAINLMNDIRVHHISPAILIISICVNFIALIVLSAASLKRANLFFVSTALTVFACFMGLVGMIWQQTAVDTAANVIKNLSNNSMKSNSGPVSAGLGWTSTFILFCVAIGTVALVLSEKQALKIYGNMPEDVAGNDSPQTPSSLRLPASSIDPNMTFAQQNALVSNQHLENPQQNYPTFPIPHAYV